MVDISILEELGITAKNLAAVIAPSDTNKASQASIDKFEKMKPRIRDRVRRGIEDNFRTYRMFHALDIAWDTPLRQISSTLLQSLVDKDPQSPETEQLLGELKMTHLLTEATDAKTGKPIKQLNLPTFFNIFVPLVKAYVTIRLARIMNERNQVPFFKYEALYSTLEDIIRAEIITSRVEMMNRQYGFYEMLKKAGFNMLHYGRVLQFPMEEWHVEEQYSRNDDAVETAAKEDPAPQSGFSPDALMTPTAGVTEVTDEPVINERFKKNTFKKVRSKEGLRYHVPHPTRTFYDKSHPATTLNTGTGCKYAGYWKIMQFGEICDNEGFYNRDKVTIGQTDWISKASGFFANVYPCTMSFPPMAGSEQNDRESAMERLYYTGSHLDKSVLITEYWEQIVPSDWGFGDYDGKVWFRFVVASDDTILYAAPVPYCPVGYAGYDADESRDVNCSLSLEVLPFQDAIGNLLTQQLLSVKQNLANLTLVDEDILTADDFDKLTNRGKMYTEVNIASFSSAKQKKKMPWLGGAQSTTRDALFTLPFRPQSTQEIISAIRMMLEILERVLVMSSQEIAQAASHEQTKEEVKNISATTSTRMKFTATPVDNLMDTMKLQIYEGLMNFGDEEFYAEITIRELNGIKIDKKLLETMGFTTDGNVYSDKHGTKKMKVKVPISAIQEMVFASQRDATDRFNDGQLAGALTQFFSTMMANPMMAAAVGPDQGIGIMNMIATFAGFPEYLRLTNTGVTPQEQQQKEQMQQQQLMQALGQMTDQKLLKLAAMLKEELASMGQAVKAEFAPVEEAVVRLTAEVSVQSQQIEKLKQGGVTTAHIVEQLVNHAHATGLVQQPTPPPDANVLPAPGGNPGSPQG